MDSKYVLSGSDDGNIRLWKANASEKMGVKDWREKNHLEYASKLKERFSHMGEIRKIDKHRHVPVDIKRADKLKKTMLASRKRKDEKMRNSRKEEDRERRVPEREKAVVGVAK